MLAAANPDLTNVTSLIEDCGYTRVFALVDLAKALFPNLGDPEFIKVLDDVSESLTGYKLSAAAPIDSLGNATMPTMFITGTADQVISPSMMNSLYSASGAEVKEIFTVEGATHGISALKDSIGYGNAVFRFNAEAGGEGWVTSNVTNNISLRGTKYDDAITSSGNYVTITGGAGNDTITNSGSSNLYIYNKGDGNDVINGFTTNDTLAVDGAKYQVTISGDDKIVSIAGSENFITLKDAANITPNIAGTPVKCDRTGHEVENPVAMIASGDATYYYESVARATNDADNNSTVTVTANSTETSTINTTKGLTIQFAESGLGVYSVTGGNFVSADSSTDAQFSVDSNRVTSNSNTLQLRNGATTTLDGYEVTRISNSYSVIGTSLDDTITNSGNYVTISGGTGNDIAFGGAGDYFDLGAGNNRVYLNSNRGNNSSGATVAMTATEGTTEVNGFSSGFDENADKISINVDGANVSFEGGKLTFSRGGASLILNFGNSSADLIADDNFIAESADISDITPITYDQGDYQSVEQLSIGGGQSSFPSNKITFSK